jgi:hypothetical protein
MMISIFVPLDSRAITNEIPEIGDDMTRRLSAVS